MTRIGIYGYGNLGRGVEAAINQNDGISCRIYKKKS